MPTTQRTASCKLLIQMKRRVFQSLRIMLLNTTAWIYIITIFNGFRSFLWCVTLSVFTVFLIQMWYVNHHWRLKGPQEDQKWTQTFLLESAEDGIKSISHWGSVECASAALCVKPPVLRGFCIPYISALRPKWSPYFILCPFAALTFTNLSWPSSLLKWALCPPLDEPLNLI